MPRSRAKPKKAVADISEPPASSTSTTDAEYAFPFLQYTSLAGSYFVLFSFAAAALPSSSKWLGFKPIPQASSLDRPQYAFLDPITSNPTATVVTISLGASVIMVWWAGWVRLWWSFEKKTKRIDDNTKRVQSKLYAMRNATIATAFGALVYQVLLVLFGAPAFSYSIPTSSLALLLSILTVYTPTYTMNVPPLTIFGYSTTSEESDSSTALVEKLTWIRLFSEVRIDSPVERVVLYPVLGTLVGCWLGAFPIALDWDRPWQAWPLLPAYGAIAGNLIGSVFGVCSVGWTLLVEQGRRMKSD